MLYRGSCHCGAVEFEVDADLSQVVRCNCSICRRKGAIMCRVPEQNFTLLKGREDLTLYQFNSMRAEHYFCRHCGIYPYHRTFRDPNMLAINVGCLDGVDPFKLQVKEFDGRSLPTVSDQNGLSS